MQATTTAAATAPSTAREFIRAGLGNVEGALRDGTMLVIVVLIVFLMSINETDETKLLFIIKFHDKPVIISVNIKNYSIIID